MSELATVARPYAKALIMFARENDSLESYQEMLENFLTLISEESVVKMLKDDSLDKAKKASILKEVVGSFADKNFQNFAETVFLNNRVQVINEIKALYGEYLSEEKNQLDVQIETAFELDESQQSRIVEALEKKLSKKINLKQHINEKLIAGAIIKADDLVIDGTVVEKLRKLKSQMN